MKLRLHLIAAVAKHTFAIGLDGKLPWHNPSDLALFKKITDGQNLIVGWATSCNLPELPGRTLHHWGSRNNRQPEDFLLDLEAVGVREAWLIGGAYVYRAFAPYVNGNIVISYVDYNGPADSYFPMDDYQLI